MVFRSVVLSYCLRKCWIDWIDCALSGNIVSGSTQLKRLNNGLSYMLPHLNFFFESSTTIRSTFSFVQCFL